MTGTQRGSRPRSAEAPAAHRFDRVLAQLPLGVVLVDRDLVIEYANPAAGKLLGRVFQGGDALPDPWDELSLPEFSVSLFDADATSTRRMVRTEERILWIEGVPPSENENAILILEDVTERERVRRGEREFVENAAHELRTPLAAIISVMDVLDGGAKDIPEVRDRFLSHIRVHSERLSRLARSFLVLARFQAGVEQPHLTAVPVQPLLEEIAARLDLAHDVQVSVRAEPNVGVLADRDLLNRIVANVAENSAKHTRVGEIVLGARQLGKLTEIEVRDTGPGMSVEERDRAFERFYRSSSPGTDGFGLGLAIAHDAARALDGTIELDSEPGFGTSVRVTLPSARIVS